MTLIERLLAQANKEANALADLLTEAAQALARPAVPDLIPVAQRKLNSLLADGYQITGYSIERTRDDTLQRGAVTCGGMVLWWHGDSQPPLTDDQIMAIGRNLGLKCRLGGNPNIDFDYARAIEAAHGIRQNG